MHSHERLVVVVVVFVLCKVFAIDVVSYLSLHYALPKSLAVARLAINVMKTMLTGVYMPYGCIFSAPCCAFVTFMMSVATICLLGVCRIFLVSSKRLVFASDCVTK